MAFNRGADNGCPCKGCEERKPGTGCHDRCDRYKAWKKKVDDRNEAERKDRERFDVMSDANKKRMWKKQSWKYQNAGGRSHNGDR